MFNPIPRIDPKLLLAPLTLSLVLGVFDSVPARAQIVIIRDRNPVRVVPQSNRGSYLDNSAIMNSSPRPSRILQSDYNSPYPTRRAIQYPTRRGHPSSSGTTVLVNPTIVVPGGYNYGYPYPYGQGSYIYYGSPSGFQIQIGN